MREKSSLAIVLLFVFSASGFGCAASDETSSDEIEAADEASSGVPCRVRVNWTIDPLGPFNSYPASVIGQAWGSNKDDALRKAIEDSEAKAKAKAGWGGSVSIRSNVVPADCSGITA